jgi:hypothetical protein
MSDEKSAAFAGFVDDHRREKEPTAVDPIRALAEAWQQWQHLPFVRVDLRSAALADSVQQRALSEPEVTRPNGRG